MNRIAVIGDTALDFSYFTHLSGELSAETGLPVNYIDKVFYDAGGAGNLASNVAALEREVDLYGICGDDFWAELLITKLQENGVETEHFHKAKKAETYVYHRIFDEKGKELPRYDHGQGCMYEDSETMKLLDELEKDIDGYSALIINQQLSNSIHTSAVSERLNTIISKTSIPVWLDTRSKIMYSGCSYKINYKEAVLLTGKETPEECASTIYAAYHQTKKENYVVVTLGENGAVAFDGERFARCKGIAVEGETDTIGCGDAFQAAICCALCEEKTIEKALQYANCAGSVCSKSIHCCGHPTKRDVETLYETLSF